MKNLPYWILTAAVVVGASIGLASTLGALEQSSKGSDSTLQQGQDLTQLFYEEKLDMLWDRFDAPMKQHFGSVAGLKGSLKQIKRALGREVSVISESVDTAEGMPFYLRVARFEKHSSPIGLQWAIDARGRVAGFWVVPAKGINGGD